MEVFVGWGEAHESVLMAYVLGTPGGPSGAFFREWVIERTRQNDSLLKEVQPSRPSLRMLQIFKRFLRLWDVHSTP